MPISYRIEKGERTVYLEHSGTMELESAIQSVIDVTGSPDFESDFRVLSDLRNVVYVPRLSEAVDFGQFLGTLSALMRGPIAAVMGNPIHFQFSKIVCLLARARGIKMRSFRDMELAKAWLDCDGDDDQLDDAENDEDARHESTE